MSPFPPRRLGKARGLPTDSPWQAAGPDLPHFVVDESSHGPCGGSHGTADDEGCAHDGGRPDSRCGSDGPAAEEPLLSLAHSRATRHRGDKQDNDHDSAPVRPSMVSIHFFLKPQASSSVRVIACPWARPDFGHDSTSLFVTLPHNRLTSEWKGTMNLRRKAGNEHSCSAWSRGTLRGWVPPRVPFRGPDHVRQGGLCRARSPLPSHPLFGPFGRKGSVSWNLTT